MLRLKKEELVTLLYHLTIMRKPFKKGIKKKHSKEEVKENVAIYAAIIDRLEGINKEDELHEIHFEHKEIELLQTFMPWYVAELEKGISEDEKDRLGEGIDILKTINNMLLVAV